MAGNVAVGLGALGEIDVKHVKFNHNNSSCTLSLPVHESLYTRP